MSSPFPVPHLTHPSPAFAPSPLSQYVANALAASSLAPGTTPNPSLAPIGISPNFGLGLTPPNLGSVPGSVPALTFSNYGGQAPGIAGGQAGEVLGDRAQMLQGLASAEGLLDRMEELLKEIEKVERGVFAEGEGVGNLESLHIEYTQLLVALLGSSQSHLFGSLPILPKSLEKENEAQAPTVQELTQWAEERAALEFSRKDAMRAGGKAVLDVLKAGSLANR
ncbi:hypothetical protein L198_07119 [Cryptococcus wingfieldii CBS 7118]|uniref:Uncharacterized protein n=1 Tax=Cryptococcus wingfieldii CBS 7118 TaxID=1295528 RepID=A0A1E3IEU7_9TREE|nr:hypothetical protein L198_07119 [Cryptococcus wingfieldii CBS 7118]ODN87117.1 hypothetical protein L198_07119 [Cryptococcus wingfieldii CBS 7118]